MARWLTLTNLPERIEDRRVLRFGKLVSTWPVTGVAVQDGVGYATAGLQKGNGVHAYAFDIKSGRVIWEKHDAGAGLKGNLDTALSSTSGSSCLAQDRASLMAHLGVLSTNRPWLALWKYPHPVLITPSKKASKKSFKSQSNH